MQRRDILVAIVLFVAVMANGTWWAAKIPPNGAPDEVEHLALVRYIAEHGRLPHYGEAGFVMSLMGRSRERVADATDRQGLDRLRIAPQPVELRMPYIFDPQLPYACNGLLCKLLGGATVPVARGVNTFWIALAVVAVFAAARSRWPGHLPVAVAAGLCVALWPQITFVGAYVNDDAFAIAAVAAWVAACVACQTGVFTMRRAVILGITTGLVFSSKPYTVIFAPLGLVWCWIWAHQAAAATGAWLFRRRLLVALGIAAIVCTPWFVRNAVLYEGDPTAHRYAAARLREFVASLPPGVLAPQKKLFLKPVELRPKPAELGGRWLGDSMTSFWARFGWMNIRPPRPYATSALWILAAAVAAAYAASRGRAFMTAPGLFALPAFVLLLAASAWNSYFADYQPQGRYLLPCVPGALLLVTGATAALRPRVSTALVGALLLFFAVQNVLLRVRFLQ